MSNLSDGIKSPVIYLYDQMGNPLANSLDVGELGIVEFTYEYDDEEEDKCSIKIQASSYQYIDGLDIQRNDVLKIRWGYMGGPLSPVVGVAVRDIKSKYGPNIIYTEYQCSDLSTYLKLTREDVEAELSLIDYIKGNCSSIVNVVIQSGTDILYKQSIQKQEENAPIYLIPEKEELEVVFNPIFRMGTNSQIHEAENDMRTNLGLPITFPLPSGTNEPGYWYCRPENEVRKYFETPRNLSGANKSPYTLIAEYLNECPYGPWFITGRGNTLLIHNRNLGNGIFRTYHYGQEPGSLMDFSAETKYDSFEKQNISGAGLDPITKAAIYLEEYIDILSKARDIKTIIDDRTITQIQKKQEISDWVALRRGAYQRYKIARIRYGLHRELNPFEKYLPDSNTPVPGSNVVNINKAIGSRMGEYALAPIPDPIKPGNILPGYIGAMNVYIQPVDDLVDLRIIADNQLRRLQMDKEEATMIIEGDPYLMSEQVVAVDGIQKNHIGKYYIKTCEHQLTEQGYKVTLNCLKVRDEAIIKSYKTETNSTLTEYGEAQEELINNYYKQENIFNNWDIEMWFETITQGAQLGGPLSQSPQAISYGRFNLNDLLNDPTINNDQIIAEIWQYVNTPGVSISYKKNPANSPESR